MLPRPVSLLVGALAAVLAPSEMAERSCQNEYLTEHTPISDDSGLFSFRNACAVLGRSGLACSERCRAPETQAHIKRADKYARHQNEGTGGEGGLAAIRQRIRQRTAARDEALH